MNTLNSYGISVKEYNERYWAQGESANSIGKSLGYPRGDWILEVAVRDGIKKKTMKRSFQDRARTGAGKLIKANLEFFKSFTPEMAWVLGLIASDGDVVNNLKTWGITSKDYSCLEKVGKLMGYTGKIRPKYDETD